MARTATKSAAENIVDVAEMIEEEENVTKKTVKAEALNDSDEIEVIALIPNVSYKDSKTLDMYEWDLAGHIEYMSFETLKNMWRSHKGYFKNMWLKPNDDRVISQFGLTKIYDKYDFLMDESNYTKKNIDTICDTIVNAPNGLKASLYDKVKSLVINGDITDVSIIRKLENRLKIDLIDFL
jgi:hypothetical protein